MSDRIVFDAKLMRPGCVLLQAAAGCDYTLAYKFPPKSWLEAPTPDMRVYPLTPEILAALVRKVNAHADRGA